MPSVTSILTEYLAAARLPDLPPTATHQAKRTFLNFIGCAVGGAYDASVDAALHALEPCFGAARATVLGRGTRADPLHAALLNGISSSVYSFDDTHAQAVVHAGGPVGCALLAFAETRKVTGADFLLAYTLGVETVCRISKAVSVAPAEGNAVWIQTGICGGIGASTAVAKLLGLDPRRMASAIGIAVAQTAGIRGVSRSMCFSLMAGQAAQSGLRAALLAEAGFTGTEDALGAAQGFAEAYARKPHLDAITEGLGQRFEIEANTFKPYPCGVVIHPVIDACLELVTSPAPDPSAIERIDVQVHPSTIALADIKHPRDPSEAQMSLQHWASAAMVDDAAGIRQSRPDKIAEPAIAALRDRVVISPDPSRARDSAEVSIRLRSGQIKSAVVAHCRGSSERPLTDQEIEDKFRAQSRERIAAADLDAIAASIWKLETIADAAEIAALAAGPPAAQPPERKQP